MYDKQSNMLKALSCKNFGKFDTFNQRLWAFEGPLPLSSMEGSAIVPHRIMAPEPDAPHN